MEFWVVFTWPDAELTIKQQQIARAAKEDLNIIIEF